MKRSADQQRADRHCRDAELKRRDDEDANLRRIRAVEDAIPDPVRSEDVAKRFKYKTVDQGQVVAYGNSGPHRGGRVGGRK